MTPNEDIQQLRTLIREMAEFSRQGSLSLHQHAERHEETLANLAEQGRRNQEDIAQLSAIARDCLASIKALERIDDLEQGQ